MHISMIGVVIIIASAILSGCEKTPEDDQKYIEGMNYYFGNGVPIDYEKAAGLLMVSAENNNPAAGKAQTRAPSMASAMTMKDGSS